MLKLIPYSEARLFNDDIFPILCLSEAENNLPIGILDRGIHGGWKADWFMARIEDENRATRLIALMTPPQNLILSSPGAAVPMDTLCVLAEHFVKENITIPGVLAHKELACAFARSYAKSRGLRDETAENLRLYRLDSVADVPRVGILRPANASDMHYLPYWKKDFFESCFQRSSDLSAEVEGVQTALSKQQYFILEVDGQPVSLAGTTRQMPHGRSIGPVYTPPFFRGHGYATACVAMLSEIILGWGNAYCALFTDLANPTSNSIYQKVGYRPLCDFAEVHFHEPK